MQSGLHIVRKLLLGTLALAAAGCGGSSGGGTGPQTFTPGCDPGSASAPENCGTVLVAITDAEGDFVSYSVDVLSLTLRRATGATVEVLPAATRIDFAQLVDLADLLAATAIAPADFVGGTIRLDYSDAEVFVEAGGDVVAAEVVDANGQPLGVTEVEILLAEREHLVVTRGRAAFLSVDFDLAASHSVDTTQSPPLVTARPYIVAEAAPVEQKELRVRGTLLEADVAAGEYTIRVRPWHRADGDHGRFTVHTTSATTFDIEGEMHVGTEGLQALAALDAGTLTVAFGTFDLQARAFTAEIVHAGESPTGADGAIVYGHVAARDGDRLTVRATLLVRPGERPRFLRTVLVDVGAETSVVQAGGDAPLDTNAISVGQRLAAFGELLPDFAPVPASPVLDATQGRVRLLVTRLHGTVSAVSTGRLELALRALDRLPVELFDFSGTGGTPALDADPASYEVATGTLGLAEVTEGEAASVLGFVTPFGAAPPDFEGRTVIDHGELRARLGIGWGPTGTAAPFVSLETSGLVLDLANADIGTRHHLLVGARLLDLLDLPAAPIIVPHADRASFGIAEPGHVELFTDFGEFVTELAARLGAGDSALGLAARGTYDAPANTLTARHVAVLMLPGQ